MKVFVTKIELDDAGIQAMLASDMVRKALVPPAEQIYDAIAPSDGDPGEARQVGVQQVNGRYRRKFIDKNAVANDGRAAVDVGVEGADWGFFRLMTLQKAARAIGARVVRRKKL